MLHYRLWFFEHIVAEYATRNNSHKDNQTTLLRDSHNMGMSGMLFLISVILLSLLLMGLVVGTVCIKLAGNTSSYATSTTTYWVYGAIAFAISVVMLLVLLYLGYAWSCACGKPACPPKNVSSCPPKRQSRNACAPGACY